MKQEALGLVFDGPENAERERAIVRRLVRDELSVMIFGGDFDRDAIMRTLIALLPPRQAGACRWRHAVE
ncbi:MAG: hypothetical protein ACREHD_01620 [Pirellulales bacterium]